jgi:hypothetical protein
MIICRICNKKLKNVNGLAKHIHNQHDISKEEYYNAYIKETFPTCICGKKKKFRHLGEGYRTYCSPSCRSKHVEPVKYWQDKKQPKEMIEARRNSMYKRYGVTNGYLVNHSKAEKYKGFVCRSKYEKLFVDFAEKYGYTLSVPDRIKYIHEGRSRHYYPDFYVEELDLIVEIKSDWTWNQNLELNLSKLTSCLEQHYDIIFIDEEHGLTDDANWDELNEYLCFGS